jgi:diguanylate cyclase (GGDEF)-like protein/PAS domain S-box-containing protein
MAKILVVDDNGTNRKLVLALLKYESHETAEAVDGSDGLEAARIFKPDLIISDILMPSMDGYEFVRQLRTDRDLTGTAVIFYTAHYHELEAYKLAEACRVARVLVKPCGAAEFVHAVEEVLAGVSAKSPECVTDGFDREHLRLMTNKLAENARQLQVANSRFGALTELNVQLASERDPRVLLEKVCHGAREILGARYAVLAATDKVRSDAIVFATSGIATNGKTYPTPPLHSGLLGRVMSERSAWRLCSEDRKPVDMGLPQDYPPAHAWLAAPLMSLTQTFGWICLADKVGADAFSAEDESILSILAAQVGRIYENGSLYLQVQHHAAHLQVEMEERERASTELRASEERFRLLAENIEDAFFIVSGDLKRTLYMSPAYERIWGRPSSELNERSLPWADAIHPEDRDRLRGEIRWDQGGMSARHEMEFRVLRPDGALRWVFARTFPVMDANGRLERLVGVATDITQRKQAEAKIQHLNRVQAMLSGINSLIVRVADRGELFREACRLAVEHGKFSLAWCGWVDAAAGELRPVAWAGASADLDQTMQFRIPVAQSDGTLIAEALRQRQPFVCNNLELASSLVPCSARMLERGYRGIVALPLLLEGAAVGALILITDEPGFFDEAEMRLLTELANDISFALDHIARGERLSYLAYYDGLTGLANRTLFQERLAQHVSASTHSGGTFALMIAEPERFDTINDTFGRHVGDELLKQLARRLIECVGDANVVGRTGSTQFAAVVLNAGEVGDVARTIEEWWRQWLSAPFTVEGKDLRITARTGIAIFPSDGDSVESLLKNAEAALKNAKATGERRLFYTRHLSEQAASSLALEHQLRDALDREEFVLFYQPKVDLETRRLTSVEALMRWKSPELGLVPPARFIRFMEETGMIVEAGAWALRRACQDRSRWLEMGLHAPRVAVNVSTVQLRRQDVERTVTNIVRLAGSDPGLDIEVTESLIMDDASGNIEKLRAVRALGIGVAIDDFGTGYSSLGYLTKLPVETLTIDRSFVAAMLDDPGAMTLVSTIISLAHALKLQVVAEGVESEEQAKFLRLLRCDQMQGYLISQPLPVDDMTAWLGRSH